jgi:hypothetical protein
MIVTLATAAAIFVGADSRATMKGPDGLLHREAGVFQKVDLVGQNSIIAASGLFGILSSEPGVEWNSMDALRDAATGLSGNFYMQFDHIGQRYKDSASQAMARLNSSVASLTTPGSPPIINIYFAQRDSGRSYLAARHFELVSNPKSLGRGWDNAIATDKTERILEGDASRTLIAREKAVITVSAPGDCPIDADRHAAHIDFLQGKFVEWIRRIIIATAAQSSSCLEKIGGPIHVAVVDDHGAHWAAPP